MSDSMQVKLPLLVAGVLPEAERQEVEAHLETCDSCQAALREWQLVAAAVRSDAEERAEALPPPESLLALIAPSMASPSDRDDHQQSEAADQTVPAPKARSRRKRLGGLTGLIILLLVLLTVVLLGGGMREMVNQAMQRVGGGSGTSALGVPAAAPAWTPAAASTRPLPTIVARRFSPTIWPSMSPRPPVAGRPVAPSVVAATNPPAVASPAMPPAVAVGPSGPLAAAPAAAAAVDNPTTDHHTPGTTPAEVVAGNYVLTVPAGRWSAYVATQAYRPQWYAGAADPFSAQSVDVAAGDRALVMAVAPDTGLGPGLAPAILGVAISDADGAYRLYMEPGTSAIGASAVWSAEAAIW